jgi:hypothetical protein
VRWLALARRTGVRTGTAVRRRGCFEPCRRGFHNSPRRTPDHKKPRKARRRPGFGIPARKVASRGPSEPVFSSGLLLFHRWRARARCRYLPADDG